MTPSGFMKPKLAFSIESLVGGQISPSLSDVAEGTESPNTESAESTSHAALEPFFSRALLNFHENPPVIKRPQPVNGAIQFSANNNEQQVHSSHQGIKDFGSFPNMILSSPLAFASFPQLHGIPMSLSPQLNPLLMGNGGLPGIGASMPRDYSPYPWLLSRHGRMFPHGLPSPEQLAYFLQPFRKPKRVRTAFSPSQLLKLEQAFEKNQYVVGVERKQLAQNLNLSETQVKVWFQNRRTKEKKVQPEDEDDNGQDTSKISDKMEEDDEEDYISSEPFKAQLNNDAGSEASTGNSGIAKIYNLINDSKSDSKLTSSGSFLSSTFSLISSSTPPKSSDSNLDAISTDSKILATSVNEQSHNFQSGDQRTKTAEKVN